MKKMTLRISDDLFAALVRASQASGIAKSEVVRRAVADSLSIEPVQVKRNSQSALDLAGDLVGRASGGPVDLASNPRHLVSFGDSKTLRRSVRSTRPVDR